VRSSRAARVVDALGEAIARREKVEMLMVIVIEFLKTDSSEFLPTPKRCYESVCFPHKIDTGAGACISDAQGRGRIKPTFGEDILRAQSYSSRRHANTP
jgi:uncharacterized FAD-dependent dehydrogenase